MTVNGQIMTLLLGHDPSDASSTQFIRMFEQICDSFQSDRLGSGAGFRSKASFAVLLLFQVIHPSMRVGCISPQLAIGSTGDNACASAQKIEKIGLLSRPKRTTNISDMISKHAAQLKFRATKRVAC